ncbi:hypothetical protein [Acuticoccus kandeliae]|uniref:hypothetical protein n=1 Tax=Acuticoccus kandeliae TaxID=2073160 RepID=UPI00130099F9|nr:hypothetical protein [Acuticoccus kandeliae]
MAINQHLEAFLHATATLAPAYAESDVRYVAARVDGGLRLLKGFLYLRNTPLDLPPRFDSHRFVGGAFKLEKVGLDLKGFVQQIMEGSLPTPEGQILMPANEQGLRPTTLTPFHAAGLHNQSRLALLSIQGGTLREFVRYPEADWDVMASETPFSSFQELLSFYELGYFMDDRCVFEVAALQAVAVDKLSGINGTGAELAILIGDKLDTEKASLGYRILSNGEVVNRGRVIGKELNWSESEIPGVLRGRYQTTVPSAAVVQCFANYAEET